MKKYYITNDLEQTIQMINPDIDINKLDLATIRKELTEALLKAFEWQDIQPEAIAYGDIKKYFQQNKKTDEFILSLENGIYIDDPDFNFSSTRMYQQDQNILDPWAKYEITQRDGTMLEWQIVNLVEKIKATNKQNIILCDDWLFSWDTLKTTIALLQNNWIVVDAIRVVVNFSGKTDIDGVPIQAMLSPEKDNFVDWIDERDFFYGTPMSWASLQDKTGKVYWISYISKPWIATKKASIPKETSKEFCKTMIEINKKLWNMINDARKEITQLFELPRLCNLIKDQQTDTKKSIIDVLDDEKNTL